MRHHKQFRFLLPSGSVATGVALDVATGVALDYEGAAPIEDIEQIYAYKRGGVPSILVQPSRGPRLSVPLKGTTVSEVATCRVKYYDAKLSKKGRGVQIRYFSDVEKAVEFAAENVLYGRPCEVEEVAS